MSKVFLNYVRSDEPFARELYQRLTSDGIQCFFANESIRVGTNWVAQIAKALDESDFLIPILSPDFCTSQWTQLELTSFLSDVHSVANKKILPLLLKELNTELPAFLKPMQYIDVSSPEKFVANYPLILQKLIHLKSISLPPRKALPFSISSFQKLISKNYIYVDKTRLIYNLVERGGAFFLSRPRRFGKSLLISTLKEICLGNRDLFKECWIYDQIPWDKYPVIHFDFLKIDYKKLGLDKALDNTLNRIAGDFNVQLKGDSISEKFADLIRKLAKDKPVVILIDEYDKPVTDYLEDIPKAEENRQILKNFYMILKGMDEYLRLLFMTGVSRFSRLSVFSDLNHLMDISFHPEYASLLGYTTQEIETYFKDYIQEYLEKNTECSRELLFQRLKEYYNGYSWDGKVFVYNPISIIYFFEYKEFNHFWFTTGTPSVLIRIAKTRGIDARGWEELEVTKPFFDKFDITNMDINLLLFQTGYLTIKKRVADRYILSYPNREVENAFLYNLVEAFSGQEQTSFENTGFDIKEALEHNNIKGFIAKMKAFLAAIPYTLVQGEVEKYYHLVFYLILKLAMGKVNSEQFTNLGRIDMRVETGDYIYIMEFKMGSAATALKQINEKNYYEQFLAQRKKIILLGIGFNSKKRNISSHALVEINPAP